MFEKIELLVPEMGESIKDAILAKWAKKDGEYIQQDDLLLELETDKVTLEVNAPQSGILREIQVAKGERVAVGDLLAYIELNMSAAHIAGPDAVSHNIVVPQPDIQSSLDAEEGKFVPVSSPAAQDIFLNSPNLDPSLITASGKGGRITKQDILAFLAKEPAVPMQNKQDDVQKTEILDDPQAAQYTKVEMSITRKTIAKRLKEAQNSAAILTTFNEIDMTAVQLLREKFQPEFIAKHNVKLGLMSFFIKAVTQALQSYPIVNAQIDGDFIKYYQQYHIGFAVATDSGLKVPVIRNVQNLSFADIESSMASLISCAKSNTLTIDQMQGGTFTVSNGGIYGSLMSTPILNSPQSGVLGMHSIVKRPVVVNNEIQILPMMYVALSYDHRIIDGKEAVLFLQHVKQCIEQPSRMLLNV